MKFDLSKYVLAVVWLLVIVNPFVAFPSWLAITLYAIGVFLVVAHLGEYIAFREVIAKRQEGPLLAFFMTFFFGVLYWKDYPYTPWDSE